MRRLVFMVLMGLMASTVVHAQVGFSAAGGAAIPMGNTNACSGGVFGVPQTCDTYSTGYEAQVSVSVTPVAMPFGIRIDGLYASVPVKAGSAANGDYTVAGVVANAIVGALGAGASGPYAIAGVGAYHLDGKRYGGVNKLGLSGGAGFRFALGGVGTFVEARYHYTPGNEGFQFVPVIVGISTP